MSYGIILAILASLFVAVSFYYQRIALKRMRKFSVRGMLLSRTWLFGLVIVGGISFIFYLLALRSERVALVQPLMNASIVFSLLLGHFLLRERITNKELASIVVVFLGIMLTAA
ncbi:MAG: EamA family transporter [Candidatus Aenigmarchaeota archaeon]|nr:EamA family transporter [Candidatus Aenigmarchaeota archaeon]